MGLFSGIAGGLIGGALGAAIWAAVAHFMQVEVGYIAWGVGLLVGLGFRFLGGDARGPVAGVAAALVAVVSILAGKWCALALALGGIGGNFEVTHEDGIARHAQLIVIDRESKGEQVAWPEVTEDAPTREQFPQDIWEKAEAEWKAMKPEDQQAELDRHKQEVGELMGKLAGQMQFQFFVQSFGFMDLLFGFLAISTAYKLAANGPMESAPAPAETNDAPNPPTA